MDIICEYLRKHPHSRIIIEYNAELMTYTLAIYNDDYVKKMEILPEMIYDYEQLTLKELLGM